MEAAGGGVVCVYLIDDNEFLRHGAEGSLCLTGIDGLVQGGGAVWCRGGIDGRLGKVNA
jgi:hypothetical protein